MPDAVAFLFDVDNTLLDNDRVKAEMSAGIRSAVGEQLADRFWELYEEVRAERDVVDLPATLGRFEETYRGRPGVVEVISLVMGYPFETALYPGALEVLGRHQAKKRDDYRDAEPGKILHELRYGELAYFKMIPHTPYYGTADATPLNLVALHAAWQATGDRALIERHLPTAEACLAWIEKYGDRDGDGFQEYLTRF